MQSQDEKEGQVVVIFWLIDCQWIVPVKQTMPSFPVCFCALEMHDFLQAHLACCDDEMDNPNLMVTEAPNKGCQIVCMGE